MSDESPVDPADVAPAPPVEVEPAPVDSANIDPAPVDSANIDPAAFGPARPARVDQAHGARLDPPEPPRAPSIELPPRPAVEAAGPRFRRALLATFAIHVAISLAAFALGSRWVGALAGASAPHPHAAEALSRIAPETFADLARNALAPLTFMTLASLLLQALLGVLLQLLWLGAMRGDASGWWAQLGRALAQLPRALAQSATLLLALVLGLGLLGALPMLWHVAFAETPDARLHDLGMLAACVPALAFVFRWRAAHDVGRAAISLDASLRDALVASWRTPATLAYVGWWALSAILLALALTASWSFGPMLALVLAQAAAFGRTLVRARWLASAQTRVASQA